MFEDPPEDVHEDGIADSGGQNEAASADLDEWFEEPSVASHEIVVIEETGGALPLEGAPPHQLSMTGLVDEKGLRSSDEADPTAHSRVEAEASAVPVKRSQSEW